MTVPDTSERIVDALYRIVRKIQTEGELPDLLEAIMRESKDLLECDASSLFLYDDENNDLYFEIVVGGDEGIRAIRVPMGQGIVGASAENRETIIVNDVESDSRHLKVGKGGFVTKNLIAVPMTRNDKLIGVLEVLNKYEGGFTEDDAKILKIMAEQAAVQIENTRLIAHKMQSERLAALGTTAAGLAHYIKNILSQWKGSSMLIDIGLERDKPQMIADAWPILKRSNAKIAKLVQDMLAISKEREPELEPVDLNAMIQEIVDESKVRAANAEVGLSVELDSKLPTVALDPNRMHDVILNIVGNGIEAIEENQMTGAEVIVRTVYRSDENRMTVSIVDTGPGIPPDVQVRIFEPFYSTKGSRGTGLGLAVVSKTIEEHGGTLTLISEVGKGSTFEIDLPCMEPEA